MSQHMFDIIRDLEAVEETLEGFLDADAPVLANLNTVLDRLHDHDCTEHCDDEHLDDHVCEDEYDCDRDHCDDCDHCSPWHTPAPRMTVAAIVVDKFLSKHGHYGDGTEDPWIREMRECVIALADSLEAQTGSDHYLAINRAFAFAR